MMCAVKPWITTILAILIGCSQTSTSSVSPVTFSSSILSGFDNQDIEVDIVDARPLEQVNPNAADAIYQTLERANPRARWHRVQTVDANSRNFITVKIITLESTFSQANWSGIVKLDVEQSHGS